MCDQRGYSRPSVLHPSYCIGGPSPTVGLSDYICKHKVLERKFVCFIFVPNVL